MVSVIKIAGDIVYLGYADGHMEKVSISAFDKTPIVLLEINTKYINLMMVKLF